MELFEKVLQEKLLFCLTHLKRMEYSIFCHNYIFSHKVDLIIALLDIIYTRLLIKINI